MIQKEVAYGLMSRFEKDLDDMGITFVAVQEDFSHNLRIIKYNCTEEELKNADLSCVVIFYMRRNIYACTYENKRFNSEIMMGFPYSMALTQDYPESLDQLIATLQWRNARYPNRKIYISRRGFIKGSRSLRDILYDKSISGRRKKIITLSNIKKETYNHFKDDE